MPDPVALGVQSTPLQNPMQTLLGIANVQNLTNQNRLFQQEFMARQAIGPLVQQSINPETGELDANKLMGLAAKNPDVAFKAPEFAQQAQQREKMNLEIALQKLTIAREKFSAMGGALGALVDKGDGVTQKDVIGKVGELIGAGILDAKTAANTLADMPTGGPQLAKWIQGYQLQLLSANERVEKMLGQVGTINLGGTVQPVRTSQLNGGSVTPIGPGLATTPTTAEMNTLTQRFNPTTRQMEVVPRVEAAPMVAGSGEVVTRPGGAAPVATPTKPEPALGTGRYPKPAQGAGVPTTPPMGAETAANVEAQESAKQGIDLQKAADAAPQMKAALGNLEKDLAEFTSGPGADWTKVSKAWINRNLPLGPFKFDPKEIASQEAFAKQAFQVAQQQFQMLGGTGTDAKLDSALSTSPNELISQMGNKGIIALLKGNTDAIAAKNREWQSWRKAGNGPESYGEFSTEFNKTYDPRVFQAVHMPAADRKAMWNAMSPQEQAQYESSWKHAVSKNWVKVP